MMVKNLLVCIILLLFVPAGNAQKDSSNRYAVLTVNGHYLGHNLYVQNPFAPDGVAFCTKKVMVNGMQYPFEHASVFAIEFDTAKFHLGDSINVQIDHHVDCMPKIIHDGYHGGISTYELEWIKIDSTNTLRWKTKKEMGKLMFTVEQFRWNKWITLGEVPGVGDWSGEYAHKIDELHAGENKFRVKQVGLGKANPSKSVTADGKRPQTKVNINAEAGIIEFSQETRYELYDAYGNIIKKGFDKVIDCPFLNHGNKKSYFLNYDNTAMGFSTK